MKFFLRSFWSRRTTHDAWAVAVKECKPLAWTTSTTRKEARQVRDAMAPDLFQRTEVIPVRITVSRLTPAEMKEAMKHD